MTHSDLIIGIRWWSASPLVIDVRGKDGEHRIADKHVWLMVPLGTRNSEAEQLAQIQGLKGAVPHD
ncbi:hypothetical protein [Streptomyces sp. NPDC102360]|uniref:hypothetical protein n=1 Tax=Streptomyces sp. NPDC102360 TaxID=3366160 RepID=UPI00380388D8